MVQREPAASAAESNTGKLQWHPAFSSAFQIELAEDRDELWVSIEHQLTRKPLIMDILIIKKNAGYRCRNAIAEFFKGHNIIEYKNPQDSYGINDLCRTLAYAGIYQSNTEKEGEIDPADITITVVCGKYPRKVMHMLKHIYGIEYHLCEPGIYRTDPNRHFPVQFVINTRLDPAQFKWLSRLRSNLTREADVEVLAGEYRGKENNPLYETVMDVIMRANREVYKEAKDMCQALRELFADELEERESIGIKKGISEGIEQGIEKGIEQGESRLGLLISRLLTDGRISDIQKAASDETFRKKYYQEYGMAN